MKSGPNERGLDWAVEDKNMKMLCIGLAYVQAAQVPVCLVTAPAPSCSAAAVTQNQTDSLLYLTSHNTTGTTAVMVVMAQMVTSPPVFKRTASVNLVLLLSSLTMIIHNLCAMY